MTPPTRIQIATGRVIATRLVFALLNRLTFSIILLYNHPMERNRRIEREVIHILLIFILTSPSTPVKLMLS